MKSLHFPLITILNFYYISAVLQQNKHSPIPHKPYPLFSLLFYMPNHTFNTACYRRTTAALLLEKKGEEGKEGRRGKRRKMRSSSRRKEEVSLTWDEFSTRLSPGRVPPMNSSVTCTLVKIRSGPWSTRVFDHLRAWTKPV